VQVILNGRSVVLVPACKTLGEGTITCELIEPAA